GLHQTLLQIPGNQAEGHPADGGAHGRQLGDDLAAISPFFDHPLDAPGLTLDSRHARDQAPVHLLIQFVHRASRPFVMMAGSHGVGGPPPARCLTYPRGYSTLEGKLTPTIPGRRHPRLSLVASNATEISADELGRLLED